MSTLTEVLEAHQAQSSGSYCKCGKQAPLGGSRGWHTGHLADAIAAAGLAIIELAPPEVNSGGLAEWWGGDVWSSPGSGRVRIYVQDSQFSSDEARSFAADIIAVANSADEGL